MISYLESDALRTDLRFYNNIQTFDFGGIDDLNRFIGNLKRMEGYEKVTRILILRDAENNVNSAIRSIKYALNDNELPVPDCCNEWKKTEEAEIQTAYTLLPNCRREPVVGALEDLCWLILKRQDVFQMKNEIQDFIDQIIEKYDSIGSHEHKSRIHTYLSVNKDFISMKIGEAAKAGAFDWEDEHLSSLRNLIAAGF